MFPTRFEHCRIRRTTPVIHGWRSPPSLGVLLQRRGRPGGAARLAGQQPPYRPRRCRPRGGLHRLVPPVTA